MEDYGLQWGWVHLQSWGWSACAVWETPCRRMSSWRWCRHCSPSGPSWPDWWASRRGRSRSACAELSLFCLQGWCPGAWWPSLFPGSCVWTSLWHISVVIMENKEERRWKSALRKESICDYQCSAKKRGPVFSIQAVFICLPGSVPPCRDVPLPCCSDESFFFFISISLFSDQNTSSMHRLGCCCYLIMPYLRQPSTTAVRSIKQDQSGPKETTTQRKTRWDQVLSKTKASDLKKLQVQSHQRETGYFVSTLWGRGKKDDVNFKAPLKI